MFLLDTNVVSAARRDHGISDWIIRNDRHGLFISVLTIGDVLGGVKKLARRDPIASRGLESWLEQVRASYANRILDVDERVALEWGRIAALRTRGDIDGLLAATAIVHGLTIATRNVADFADSGVAVVNPWEA